MPRHGGWGQTDFGTRLRSLRESKGLTQKQLSDVTGVHPNTIAKLERGEQDPAWPVVLLFAQALEVECTAFGGLVDSANGTDAPAPPAAEVPKPKRGRPKKNNAEE